MEERGHSPGYMKLFSDMIDNMSIQEGENILDIGCGTGALDRYLSQLTKGKNPILGLDINPHLLEVVNYLVEKAKLADLIEFQTGNAEKLPFPDNSYSAIISTTVMEEVNADRMLSDMIRVTKPGGRIGVIIRAEDMPIFINIDVRTELKAKYETIRLRPEERGCFTASLYKRFHRSGLIDIKMMPQIVVLYNANGRTEKFMQAFFLSRIKREEKNEWLEALNNSATDGTFFITWPHHCAIGTKAG
jgi:ubiquinone/menaquinone biosynthesis C-methylase UbiE